MDPLLIQRPPIGLLDLLGLKGTGQSPVRLAETVAATLGDCVDYYLAPRRTTIQGSTAVVLAAFGAFTVPAAVVPSTEIWFVYAAGLRLSGATAAGTSLNMWLGLNRASGTLGFVPLTRNQVVGAAAVAADGLVFNRPYILSPGDSLVVMTGEVTGAPNVFGTVSLDVCRLTL